MIEVVNFSGTAAGGALNMHTAQYEIVTLVHRSHLLRRTTAAR